MTHVLLLVGGCNDGWLENYTIFTAVIVVDVGSVRQRRQFLYFTAVFFLIFVLSLFVPQSLKLIWLALTLSLSIALFAHQSLCIYSSTLVILASHCSSYNFGWHAPWFLSVSVSSFQLWLSDSPLLVWPPFSLQLVSHFDWCAFSVTWSLSPLGSSFLCGQSPLSPLTFSVLLPLWPFNWSSFSIA